MTTLADGFDPFSREALEFQGVIDLFRPLLSGPLSVPALDSVAPQTEKEWICRALDLTREAAAYLNLNPRPRLGELADPRPILERLCLEGASCPAVEIYSLVELAQTAIRWRTLFPKFQLPRLGKLAQSFPDLDGLIRALAGKILPDGSVDASASAALGAIRRSMQHFQRELQTSLERLMGQLARAGALQEELITVRNGRFVLPVRAEKRKTTEGIVHGSSSSGATVYIEPLETVPLNNELVELAGREEEEIRRILTEFTARLRERRQELMETTGILSELDLAFAKAEFSRRWDACLPEFSEAPELELREARHPLLEQALHASAGAAVPLTVELAPPHSAMVISGPNTGGKTVVLKTVGVAALMAQAGLPVFAERARLPVFTRVLADIGDRQSIAESLSTFSAHIRNIQTMTATAGRGDLVLLDEIGGSTDPQEGSALAVALLERFKEQGSVVFATTHYSRVKAWAAESPAAVNAAMGFDEQTLAPTYQVLAGLPGNSSGLDIAQRLGLDPAIICKARELLDPAEAEAGALITSLDAKQAELAAAVEDARRRAGELNELKAEMAREWLRERQAKLQELDQRLEQTLRKYGEQYKSAIEEVRRGLAQQGKPAASLATASRKGERLRREAREDWNANVLEAVAVPGETGERERTTVASVGDLVRVRDLSTPGTVTAIGEAGEMEVQVGRLRLRVPRSDVRILVPGNTSPLIRFEVGSPSPAGPLAEINVIGRTAEEAREEIDKFLDSAFLAGRFRLRVIHGHGKGILRRSLREMFASHPHVERSYPAPQDEGGDGATIVELKR
jgi:DNA mismatch repair protein MutS2